MGKIKKIIFNEQMWDDNFDISTHHRESTYEFIDGEINGKQWIKRCYDKSARKMAQNIIKQNGVKKSRTKFKKLLTKMGLDP